MKERPILFTGDMVRALLREENPKTQTRRKVNMRDIGMIGPSGSENDPASWGYEIDGGIYSGRWAVLERSPQEDDCVEVPCPYGVPGDHLWVRETQRVIDIFFHNSRADAIRVRYEADGTESDWIEYPKRLQGVPEIGKCLAYGGFRESSRILLENTAVRAERVQEISEEDVIAEGVRIPCDDGVPLLQITGPYAPVRYFPEGVLKAGTATSRDYFRAYFASLWDSINAKNGHPWSANEWVWVVGLRLLSGQEH